MDRMILKANEKDPYFVNSAENKFLKRSLDAYRLNDIEAYGAAC